MTLFTDGPADDPIYKNLLRAEGEGPRIWRQECDALWCIYKKYADREFQIEIRNNFHARYWEMYFAVSLIEQGYAITCPKPGPDVGIIVDGQRVWFEATCPTRGAPVNADRVPEMPIGVARTVPNEQMILRYLSSISDKYHRQYKAWLAQEIVSKDDAFIIALNPKQLDEFADSNPPRILQAAFNVGPLYAVIDARTGEHLESGYHFRENIVRASGVPIPTGVFMQDEYSQLSALLCSRIDVANKPKRMGDDFQLVPNPKATNQLPEEFRLAGTYFRLQKDGDEYSVVPEEK